MAGDAGLKQQSEAVRRTFEVLYLDERVRVVRFLPDRNSDSLPQLFIFEREGVEAEEDDAEVFPSTFHAVVDRSFPRVLAMLRCGLGACEFTSGNRASMPNLPELSPLHAS